MKRSISCCLFVCFIFFHSDANAGRFVFDGNIDFHNDVSFFSFTLNQDGIVDIFTDSFAMGGNFDPSSALWSATGTLLGTNSDLNSLDFDTGFRNQPLLAGNYLLSIAAFANRPIGPTLTQGFFYDNDKPPVPIEDWWVNGSGYFHLIIDNVDYAAPVPIPSTVLLLSAGLIFIVGASRKKALNKK